MVPSSRNDVLVGLRIPAIASCVVTLRRFASAGLVAAGLVGCTGAIGGVGSGGSTGDPGGPGGPGDPVDPGGPVTCDPAVETCGPITAIPPDPAMPASSCTNQVTFGSSPLRRLSVTEYTNTVRDLFKDQTLAPVLIVDAPTFGFFNNADVLSVTDGKAESYQTNAEAIATKVTGNLGSLWPCLGTATAANEAACVQQFIAGFGERAFRRPLDGTEMTTMTKVFTSARTDGDTLAQAVATTLHALLQSPYFLYRAEVTPATAGQSYARLSAWELASRLSYTLWGSMPDTALFDAARGNALGTRDEIAAQAQRMLADPRARAMVATFNEQWLQIYDVNSQSVPLLKNIGGLARPLFPDLTPSVATAMQTETETFLDEVTWNSGGNVMDMFTAPYSFRNKALSTFYKTGAAAGTSLTRVDLDGSRYSGLLTVGGVMAAIAHPDATQPTQRGKWVRLNLLCQLIVPPPADLALDPPSPDPALSTREQAIMQRSAGSCGACHQLTDKIGFGFENYDPSGRWRDVDGGKPVDASGEIVKTLDDSVPEVFGTFNGAPDLGRKLAASDEARQCLVTNWFRFAWGRGEQDADACARERLDKAFSDSGNHLRDLLVAMTQSDAFLYRNVEGGNP